jgi:hypothetical protein
VLARAPAGQHTRFQTQLGALPSLLSPLAALYPLSTPPPRLQGLGTNHPASDYHNRPLLVFLEGASRDDCIYGLKQCAKKGHTLQPGCARWHARMHVDMQASKRAAHSPACCTHRRVLPLCTAVEDAAGSLTS